MITSHRKSKQRKLITEKVLWYVYMLRVEHPMKKTCYYTGITQDIGRSVGDHLYRRGYGWMSTVKQDSIRVPVFIDYFFGTECEARVREKYIKHLCQVRKVQLIKSKENKLRGYKLGRHLIIERLDHEGEEVLKII